MFPGQIRQLLKDWITGFATTLIDDRLVHVVQGTEADDTPVKFYFDRETGLLLRMLRYANTRIGLNPIQVDYADYRTVSGVEMPFMVTVTWTDGRSVTSSAKWSQMLRSTPRDSPGPCRRRVDSSASLIVQQAITIMAAARGRAARCEPSERRHLAAASGKVEKWVPLFPG